MQGCSNNEQLIGRAKTLELAYGCADQVPAEGDWNVRRKLHERFVTWCCRA